MVFEQSQEIARFKDKLPEYEFPSKQVSVDYVDADRKPTVARQYPVQTYGTVVFEYKGRTERVVGDAEQDLTNGIIKVVSGAQRKVYFLAGPRRARSDSTERPGYATIKAALERENYGVERLLLVQAGAVPDDAAAVVVAGPTTDLLPPELAAIKAYLDKGGKLLLMIDPAGEGAPSLPRSRASRRSGGPGLGRNVVVDASGIGQLIGTDASAPVAVSYPPHPITERFGVLTAYPLARSVRSSPAPGGVNGASRVRRDRRAQLGRDRHRRRGGKSGEARRGQGRQTRPDRRRRRRVAGRDGARAGEARRRRAGRHQAARDRVVVIGDSDFAANYAINIQGNRDLFMNIVGWLTQQENLIAIRPKEAGDSRLTLTADQSRSDRLAGAAHHPGRHLRAGHLHLVAEAVMRGFRSTFILLRRAGGTAGLHLLLR